MIIKTFLNVFLLAVIVLFFSTIPGIANANWCHDFNINLGFSESGSEEVVHLHTALQKEGISYAPDGIREYTNNTALAVMKFQNKHGIKKTGYVGSETRTKLNFIYACDQTKKILVPINGVCGLDNGQIITVAPENKRCLFGVDSNVSSLSGSGIIFYQWSCSGSNGGTVAFCNATRLLPKITVSINKESLKATNILTGHVSELAAFSFINNTATTQTISEITFNLIGNAGASAINSVQLFDGSNALSTVLVSPDGKINFSDLSVSLSANKSLSLVVKANISATVKDKSTIGLSINSATDIIVSDDDSQLEVSGVFPIKGNLMTISPQAQLVYTLDAVPSTSFISGNNVLLYRYKVTNISTSAKALITSETLRMQIQKAYLSQAKISAGRYYGDQEVVFSSPTNITSSKTASFVNLHFSPTIDYYIEPNTTKYFELRANVFSLIGGGLVSTQREGLDNVSMFRPDSSKDNLASISSAATNMMQAIFWLFSR